MDEKIKVRLKVSAYERGSIPRKMSQLENDASYATEQWVQEHFRPGQGLDGGNISDPSTSGLVIDGGVL